MSDILIGSVAGMAGKLLEYPFDTVKVRLQSSSFFSGPWTCIQSTFRTDGLLGFYRGLSPPLIGAAAENACLFYTYNWSRRFLASSAGQETSHEHSLLLKVTAGAMSGAFTSWILTPIELVKCQLQVGQRSNPFRVIKRTFRRHGITGFWRGQLGTLLRETGGSAAWFGAYEYISLHFRDTTTQKVSLHGQLLAGACAGIGYNITLFPADTIKSRMQTEAHLRGWEDTGVTRAKAVAAAEGRRDLFAPLRHARAGFVTVGKEIWHEGGVHGFYRGAGITVLRSAPSSAIIFYVYTWLRDHLDT